MIIEIIQSITLLVLSITAGLQAKAIYILNKEVKALDKSVDKTIKDLNDRLAKMPVYTAEKNTYEPEVNEYDIGENRRVPFDDMKFLQVDGAPRQALKIYK